MVHCFDFIGCCLDIRFDSIPVCLMELELFPSGFFGDVWHCVKICDYDGMVRNSRDAGGVFPKGGVCGEYKVKNGRKSGWLIVDLGQVSF